jgi:hypothetical protein
MSNVEYASGRGRMNANLIMRIARQPREIRDSINRSRVEQGMEPVDWPVVADPLVEARARGGEALVGLLTALNRCRH